MTRFANGGQGGHMARLSPVFSAGLSRAPYWLGVHGGEVCLSRISTGPATSYHPPTSVTRHGCSGPSSTSRGAAPRSGLAYPRPVERMPEPGDLIEAFSPLTDRCFRMIQSRQLQATHCRGEPTWKGVWKDRSGRSWYVRGVPIARAEVDECCVGF